MEYAIGILFLVGVVLIVWKMANGVRGAGDLGDDKRNRYKYNPKFYIMTRCEQAFFLKLEKLVGDKYYIFPQVHLSSIFDGKIKGQNWKGAFLRINGKSVDFALYSKKTMRLVVAIELDDSSHGRKDRQRRDEDVEKIFESAGVALMRVKVADGMDSEKLKEEIEHYALIMK